MFFLQRKKQKPKWHPEDKWAEQTPDRMQFITKLQTHCLSEMVTAIIVLTHLNYDISHYCGDYSASINHKGLIFLTGLLARELRQDIMPCPAILHSSCQSVLMAVLCLVLWHQHRMCPSHCKWGPWSCNEHLVAKPRNTWGVALAAKITWCQGLAVPQALGISWQCLFGLQCSSCNTRMALGSPLHPLVRKVSGTVQIPASWGKSELCLQATYWAIYLLQHHNTEY